MIYYYIFLLMFLVFGALEIYALKDVRISLYLFTLTILILFAGLRYNTGTDYANYKNIYNDSTSYANVLAYGVEPGFYIFNHIFRVFNLDFTVFLFFFTLVNISLKFIVFKRHAGYLFAALIIYFVGLFFERDFDGIRQGLSIAICYLSIKYILSRQLIPFLLIVLFACLFHYSSAVFILLYFISEIKLSNLLSFILIAIGLLIVITKIYPTKILVGALPESPVKGRIDNYLYYDETGTYNTEVGLSMGILFRIFIFAIFVFFEKYIDISKKLYNMLKNGFLIGIVFSLMFNDVNILSHRLPYVFREFQIFIIPSFLTIPTNKKVKVLLLFIIFLYGLFLLFRILNTEHLMQYYIYHNYINSIFE